MQKDNFKRPPQRRGEKIKKLMHPPWKIKNPSAKSNRPDEKADPKVSQREKDRSFNEGLVRGKELKFQLKHELRSSPMMTDRERKKTPHTLKRKMRGNTRKGSLGVNRCEGSGT